MTAFPTIAAGRVSSAAQPFTTAWKFAGTGANIAGGNDAWDNPGNIIADDGDVATSGVGNATDTQTLRATNFGFSASDIPEGAQILGIEVGVMRRTFSAFGSGGAPQDLLVRLRIAAGQVGDDKASPEFWPTVEAEKIYGAAEDDWNAGLTDADVRSAGFGVDLRVVSSAAGSNLWTLLVDFVRVRVHGVA